MEGKELLEEKNSEEKTKEEKTGDKRGTAYLTGRMHYSEFITSCKKAGALAALAEVFASSKYEAIGFELETVREGKFYLFESIITAEEWANGNLAEFEENDKEEKGIIPLYNAITANYIITTTLIDDIQNSMSN